ncbi:hypothetical protein [Endobacterium cereale]|uniref:hypothetical protein n=1 Tax=Endobacterium cereale TaxID=2663029 RepID=UPI002B479C05|nr:hypothetical protein [Endobacterium cereale]MEB2845921.1 hypothetical protein [Endobacterium cereale]
MTDYIEVKPLRTFDNGSGLKTVDSDPFPVERGEANALKALGLVEFEDDAEPVAVPESAEPAEPISSARVAKKKEKASADNEAT